jgi:predicted TIM-barrel fold metal-dependent hydrolase
MSVTGEEGSGPLDRRRFLQAGALGGALALTRPSATLSQGERDVAAPPSRADDLLATITSPMVDVNVYVSHWPFRRLPDDETPEIVARLKSRSVTRAWAGSFDALLHRDVAAVNTRLARECELYGDGVLVPFGVVNPKLPDWEDDLRRCQEEHAMPGIRLHPNYHGYTLADPDFARLLELAAERKLIVQIALTMEDPRTQHPLVQVPHVDPKPLVDQARRLPGLPLILINAFWSVRPATLGALAGLANVSFDIAMLENVGGVAALVERVGNERVLFGSYAPFYYFESAFLKLKESPLPFEQLAMVAGANAERILP